MKACDNLLKKVRKLDYDAEAVSEWCGKSIRQCSELVADTVYIDENLNDAMASISHSAIRPIKSLIQSHPELEAEVLDAVRQMPKPTRKNISILVENKRQWKFKAKIYDIWSFGARDPRYGQEGYKWGLIAGQIVENLLYYYTTEGDYVLDTMAGGGTTIDVCNAFDRTCIAFDIEPVRDDIYQHDITEGPPMCDPCQLAIIEPPYFNMKQDAYKSFSDYLTFIRYAVRNTSDRVKEGGYVALITMDQVVKGDRPYPLIGEAYIILKENKLTFEHLIALPLTTQQYNPQQVEKAKKNRSLLGINRQIWVMRK